MGVTSDSTWCTFSSRLYWHGFARFVWNRSVEMLGFLGWIFWYLLKWQNLGANGSCRNLRSSWALVLTLAVVCCLWIVEDCGRSYGKVPSVADLQLSLCFPDIDGGLGRDTASVSPLVQELRTKLRYPLLGTFYRSQIKVVLGVWYWLDQISREHALANLSSDIQKLIKIIA